MGRRRKNILDPVVPGRLPGSQGRLDKSPRTSRGSLRGMRALKAENKVNKNTETSQYSAGCYFFSFQIEKSGIQGETGDWEAALLKYRLLNSDQLQAEMSVLKNQAGE